MNETVSSVANDVLLTDPHMMDDAIAQIVSYHHEYTIVVIVLGIISLLLTIFIFVERLLAFEYSVETILKLVIPAVIIVGLGITTIVLQNTLLCLIYSFVGMFVITSFLFKRFFN